MTALTSTRRSSALNRLPHLPATSPTLVDLDQDYHLRQLIFHAPDFQFPYHYRFPGQEKTETILFAAREAAIMLYLRLAATTAIAILLLAFFWIISIFATNFFPLFPWPHLSIAFTILTLTITGITLYWQFIIWRRTIGLVTTFRLIKFVQTSPFSSALQSLPLRQVVDTSITCRGFFDQICQVSTFTARSSATSSGLATTDAAQGHTRINKKYFYFQNIHHATDLDHYLHKLLHALTEKTNAQMRSFRPFIVTKRGQHRQRIIDQFPEFWS